MSKEMLELAERFAGAVVGLYVEGETPFILIAVSVPERDAIVAALRASAVAEPVGFACSAEIGVNRHHLGLSVEQMGVYETPVYTHPAPAAPVPNLQGKLAGSPAAPVPASMREALEAARDYVEPNSDWAKADRLLIKINAAIAALPAPEAAPTPEDDDETYEIGKRDGYENAIQDLDLATGGDGEFRGSTFPGETVDVPVMKARIIERFEAKAAAPTREDLLQRARQFIADSGCDEDDSEVNVARDELLAEIDAILALKAAPAK